MMMIPKPHETKTGLLLAAALAWAGCAGPNTGRGAKQSLPVDVRKQGILVVAPDRGFLGDEEVRDAFQGMELRANAQLAFATDKRTRDDFDSAAARLIRAGAERITVVPFFVTSRDAKLKWVEAAVRRPNPPVPMAMGPLFGKSYLAVEVLSDRFRSIEGPAGRNVIVVGQGAADAESKAAMEKELQAIADQAAAGFGFASVKALALASAGEGRSQADSELAAAAKAGNAVVVPFHLGSKLDGMMTFTAGLHAALPAGASLISEEITPHPAVGQWMRREANRVLPLDKNSLGVVFLAHGSDYHWNETMKRAIAPLNAEYRIDYAFCMADQPLVERAVKRLEDAGARQIVIVRVFGLSSSFASTVERMAGIDAEKALSGAGGAEPGPSAAAYGHDHMGHGGHGGHGAPASAPADPHAAMGHGDMHGMHGMHGMAMGPSPRIRSSALLTTVGGLEAHPLFAKALLERARALSKQPSKETVILVAHGAGDETQNDHWLDLLGSLAASMKAQGGSDFKDIRVGTWREDWPELSKPWVAKIRAMVQEASQDGGKAIVIPARTNDQGQEKELLSGLTFELGTGFAPHPLFAEWVDGQIREGMRLLAAQAKGASEPDARTVATEPSKD
jgi:sirohydrochlorin ferrochelatase